MKRTIALALAAIAAMFVLVGCISIPDSTPSVQVVGDNVARLPAGNTMVLHKGGKGIYTWIITYNGKSTVHFYREGNLFQDDINVDITVDDVDKEVAFQTSGLWTPDMYVSRRSDGAVNVRWDDGLAFQTA